MPDRIPQNFLRSSEGAVASYSFTDIAEGTGVVIYNGCDIYDAATQDYIITTSIPYSDSPGTQDTSSLASVHKVMDIDFDITFNRPQRIRGDLQANVTLYVGHGTAANSSEACFVNLIPKHFDGTTETQLFSSQSSDFDAADQEVRGSTRFVKGNIPNVQLFNAGDTLRITIEVWCRGNNTPITFFHDPKSRTANLNSFISGHHSSAPDRDAPTTTLNFYVPFVIDI
jgi:hypothetical protein